MILVSFYSVVARDVLSWLFIDIHYSGILSSFWDLHLIRKHSLGGMRVIVLSPGSPGSLVPRRALALAGLQDDRACLHGWSYNGP